MKTIPLLFALLAVAGPAHADTAYTIVLTDAQVEALVEHTRHMNAPKPALGGFGQKRAAAVVLTPDDVLRRSVNEMIGGWEKYQGDAAATKPWPEKTAREKRLTCRQQKLDPCPK